MFFHSFRYNGLRNQYQQPLYVFKASHTQEEAQNENSFPKYSL